MKDLLKTMFEGWQKHETSWDGEKYLLSQEDAMIQTCNGEEIKGQLLVLFSHWSNDIISLAAHYGIGIDENGLIIEIPSPPSPNHWWFKGKWNEPMIYDNQGLKQCS